MSAPPIPTQLRGPSARTWPAWEYIWDQLDDGEWHRGADLAEAALREGFAAVDRHYLLTVIAKAWKAGLVERETRPAPGHVRAETTTLAPPLRPVADPWYRRSR